MINGSRRGGSAQCCHLVAGGTSLLLLGLLALLNLLLFIGSKCNGDFAAGTDPFSRPEVLSAAELTRLWMLRAADHSGKAKDGTDLYVQTLGFEPFDPSQKVNAWDVYPPDVACPDITRVGNIGDGGKFVCGLSWFADHSLRRRKCVVYSYGISTDTSFENDIAARTGCSVYGFDPTVGEMRIDLARNGLSQDQFVFHKSALSTASGFTPAFALTEHLYDTMSRLNHSYIDILKVDVEGAEWVVFEDLLRRGGAPRFGQLLIELHFKTAAQLDTFMADLHNAGYLSFSREINLIPTLKGGLPLAVEYSFINPGLFFAPDPPFSPPFRGLSSWHAPINGVIYILTHSRRVLRIGQTLNLIYNNLWKQFPHYPVIIFHDDLEEIHKDIIQRAVSAMPLKFIKVPFELPPQFATHNSSGGSMESSRRFSTKNVPERTICSALSSTIGYRHMIRFHATLVHDYLDKLSWRNGGKVEFILRLDDDSYITHPVGYDIFRFMKANNMSYGFINMVKDDPLCIRGLWDHASAYYNHLKNNSLGNFMKNNSFFDDLDEGAVFYNNFEVSSAEIWRDRRWKSYMDRVDQTGNIYLERWGDAPLHTVGVGMLVGKHRVHKFTDIGYRHDPFIFQSPAGLPRPGQDPLRGDDSICVFYEQWICTRTNTSRVYVNMGVPLPAWAVVSQAHSYKEVALSAVNNTAANHLGIVEERPAVRVETKHVVDSASTAASKGVLYTFMDIGMEKVLADLNFDWSLGTLNSFYENYAKKKRTPFVVFYEGADPRSSRNTRLNRQHQPTLQRYKLELLLSERLMQLVTLVPVDLLHLNRTLECTDVSSNKLSEWLCGKLLNSTVDLKKTVSPLPSIDCLGQNSTNRHPSRQSNYIMTVSAFLSFRANNILIGMGFDWSWRFSLSSKLLRPVDYNVFDHVGSQGKRYAFLSVIQDRDQCTTTAWEVARDLCQHRQFSDCRGLIEQWPAGLVILTNFEISHRSVWESSIYLEFISRLVRLQSAHARSYGVVEQGADAKTLWWWKDPTVHTLNVLLSLSIKDTLKLPNFPYQLVEVSKSKRRQDKLRPAGNDDVHSVAYKHRSLPQLDYLFRPQRFGWLGADVAASFLLPSPAEWTAALCSRRFKDVSLPSACRRFSAETKVVQPKQYIWLFGDTIIGTSSEKKRLEGVVVPNSVGVVTIDVIQLKPDERLKQLKYFWGSGSDGIPKAVFMPPDISSFTTFNARHFVNDTVLRVAGATEMSLIKFWPLSGVSAIDTSLMDTTGSLPEETTLMSACNLLILGHIVLQHPKATFKRSPEIELLLGSDALDFSILRSAFAIVSNPYAPPNMWVYDWRIFPEVRMAAGNVSYEWFGLTPVSSVNTGGVTTTDYLYLMGVFVCTSSRVPSEANNAAEATQSSSYNVLGRVSVASILTGRFDVEVMTQHPASSAEVWASVHSPDIIAPTRCFPFSGVATEGTLDFDEELSQWIFVALIMVESILEVCRHDPSQSGSSPPPIGSCQWQCQEISIIDKTWIGRSNIIAYAGRMHPELVPDRPKGTTMKEFIVSYVPNVAGEPHELFLEMNNLAYTPKFVSIRFDASSAKPAAGLLNNILKIWK